MPAITDDATPNRLSTAPNNGRFCATAARPSEMRLSLMTNAR